MCGRWEELSEAAMKRPWVDFCWIKQLACKQEEEVFIGQNTLNVLKHNITTVTEIHF